MVAAAATKDRSLEGITGFLLLLRESAVMMDYIAGGDHGVEYVISFLG
jgi:hypothetical protein